MRQRGIVGPLLLVTGLAAAGAGAQEESAFVDRMLEQVGGREVWATAGGFHMVEILHSESIPLPAVREYWVDFEQPRIMERMVTNGVTQLQALNVDAGWVVRDGTRSDWSDEQVAGWSSFWPGIPTRVFHLLASRDPSVDVRLTDGNRLEVSVDGRFAVWIATDDEGTPVAYGREAAHTFTHFLGGMETYGPVRLWRAAYEPGDLWRVVMVDYDLFDEMPVSYEPPPPGSDHRPARVTGSTSG